MQINNLLETAFKGLIVAALVRAFTGTTPNLQTFQPPSPTTNQQQERRDTPITPGNHRRTMRTPTPSNFKLLATGPKGTTDINASYADSNGNTIVDPEDRGYFAPASTTKIFVAAAAVEAYGGTESLEKLLTPTLVVSDNQTANQLIRKVGGLDRLNQILRNKGFKNTYFSRYYNDTNFGRIEKCNEEGRPGNCTTAGELIAALKGLREGKIFNLKKSDRQWLLDTMGLTPRQAGYDKPDNWDRFANLEGPQKSGLSLTGHWYSTIGYSAKHKTYYVATLEVPKGTSEQEAIAQLNQLTKENINDN